MGKPARAQQVGQRQVDLVVGRPTHSQGNKTYHCIYTIYVYIHSEMKIHTWGGLRELSRSASARSTSSSAVPLMAREAKVITVLKQYTYTY
jgi:hypothetical protein